MLNDRLLLCALALALALPAAAQSRSKPRAKPPKQAVAAPAAPSQPSSQCGEENGLAGNSGSGGDASSGIVISEADPRSQLQELVQRAQQRSISLGAATLLAQAARDDWQEAAAGRLPTISLGGTFAHAGNKIADAPDDYGPLARATLSVTAPLYDAGRIEKLAAWRSQLAESARQGLINTEQQLALQTVSLAMERSRYQLQAQVYAQYVRKMACLVEALGTIVQADRGRASELVQAQKNKQQAELAVAQTHSALRQTETRLRRFVGDDLPPSASYAAVLTQVPDLAQMQADILQAPEVAQLAAQARAQTSYAESVAASHKPQLSLLSNGSGQISGGAGPGGRQRSGEWVVGVSVNIPIFTPGADAGIAAARKRAEAARLQREDSIEGRRYRVLDMHEAASSSFERARLIVDILRNSERLRASTLQQWQQLGRRSLFDVMGAEADYYTMRVAHVNAIFDGQQAVALLWSLGRGVMTPLR